MVWWTLLMMIVAPVPVQSRGDMPAGTGTAVSVEASALAPNLFNSLRVFLWCLRSII